jgi:hypothetical protein
VNQASCEAVVLTLQASILTPARSACLKRRSMGSERGTYPDAGYKCLTLPPPRVFRFMILGAQRLEGCGRVIGLDRRRTEAQWSLVH